MATTKEEAPGTHKDQDELLNRELEDTFPASDPPSSNSRPQKLAGLIGSATRLK